uniref:RGS domain-containing protein n=1 Tax=Macrostomum lignano TaxID=282301 RepID=A0A1I8GYV1_9PLAT
MQHPDTGVTFKAQKAFLSTVPAAVSGSDLIGWIRDRLTTAGDATEEAAHIAHLLAVYGYVYPLAEGHSLLVKDDSTSLYRFQAPYFWLSVSGRPDNVDYAIYLTKRMIRSKQKSGFEEYEKTALTRLQKLLADRWQFIALQAEEELKLARERKKNDRMVLEMQERAYWRVHRPPPGYMNPVDHPLQRHFNDVQMQRRMARGREQQQQQHDQHMQKRREKQLQQQEAALQSTGAHCTSNNIATAIHKSMDIIAAVAAAAAASSAAAATGTSGSEDQTGTPAVQAGSPWLQDDQAAFHSCQGTGESGLTPRQVKLWGTSFDFLLRDPAGREYFRHFLTREFSSENLRFWLAVQDYKFGPVSQLHARMESIFAEFLASGAPSEINIDSRTMTATQRGMQEAGRFSFEEAQEHIYMLMKKDSYQRFLRSEDYKCLLQASADKHGQQLAKTKKAAAAHAFSFVKRQQAGGGGSSSKNRTETVSSTETSSSNGNRPMRSNPVVVVQMQQQQQASILKNGGGASTSYNYADRGTIDEVTPWEAGDNQVTPWETAGNPENPVTPWETAAIPSNPSSSKLQHENLMQKQELQPDDNVTPWESAAVASNAPENLVTPWESAAAGSSSAAFQAVVTAPDNQVTPWETADNPENAVTPWEKSENAVTPWE